MFEGKWINKRYEKNSASRPFRFTQNYLKYHSNHKFQFNLNTIFLQICYLLTKLWIPNFNQVQIEAGSNHIHLSKNRLWTMISIGKFEVLSWVLLNLLFHWNYFINLSILIKLICIKAEKLYGKFMHCWNPMSFFYNSPVKKLNISASVLIKIGKMQNSILLFVIPLNLTTFEFNVIDTVCPYNLFKIPS